MALLTDWINRVKYLVLRARFDHDLEGEVQFHIDTRAAELEQSGLSPNEAHAQARREFGSVRRMRENSRAAWQFSWLEDIVADFHYGLRTFRRNPGFTFTAVLSLALGIGANSAIFTVLDAVLWKPLPVQDPGTLVNLSVSRMNRNTSADLPVAFVRQLEHAAVFSAIATASSDGLSFSHDDRAERIVGEVVSPELLHLPRREASTWTSFHDGCSGRPLGAGGCAFIQFLEAPVRWRSSRNWPNHPSQSTSFRRRRCVAAGVFRNHSRQ